MNAEQRATVSALMKAAFDIPRDPRSDAYKRGVRAIFEYRIAGVSVPHPFAPGSAESDAFHAGTDEGHRRWREHQEALQ